LPDRIERKAGPLEEQSSGPKRLNIGCGNRHLPGFIHVDVENLPHVDYIADAQHLWFAKSETIDLVYASHILEHFGRNEFKGPLREWYRVLKPGGTLRLAVPDFSACASIYYERGLENGLTGLIGLIMGGQRNSWDFHKMIFDEPFLTQVLKEVGFTKVQRWEWRDVSHRDVDDFSQAYIPHMDKEGGTLMSLNLEAYK